MHAMVNIKDAGPIAGPAAWMNITGSWDDFTNPVKLLTGETIDTETFNYSNGMFWHILWLGLGIFWIGYYVARPMFLPRSRVLLAYGDELLLDPMDKKVAWIVLILTFGIVWGGYRYTETKHPYTVPIQAGESKVQPHAGQAQPHRHQGDPRQLRRTGTGAAGDHDHHQQRRQRLPDWRIHHGRGPVHQQVGLKHLDRNYPKELVATGLSFDNDTPIAPGETREVKMEAKDALWEVQRLMALLGDPESRFGGLLMTWNDAGDRNINSIAGAVIPVFTKL